MRPAQFAVAFCVPAFIAGTTSRERRCLPQAEKSRRVAADVVSHVGARRRRIGGGDYGERQTRPGGCRGVAEPGGFGTTASTPGVDGRGCSGRARARRFRGWQEARGLPATGYLDTAGAELLRAAGHARVGVFRAARRLRGTATNPSSVAPEDPGFLRLWPKFPLGPNRRPRQPDAAPATPQANRFQRGSTEYRPRPALDRPSAMDAQDNVPVAAPGRLGPTK